MALTCSESLPQNEQNGVAFCLDRLIMDARSRFATLEACSWKLAKSTSDPSNTALAIVCPIGGDPGRAGNARPAETKAPLVHDGDALTTAAPRGHLRGVTAS